MLIKNSYTNFYNDAMRRFVVIKKHVYILIKIVVLGGSLAMNHHDAQRWGSTGWWFIGS